METDHQVIGKVGRLTAAIEPGRMGEVMIPIRGGSEAFFAYAAELRGLLDQTTNGHAATNGAPAEPAKEKQQQ